MCCKHEQDGWDLVPHMHWHIVPRFRDDPLWPRPIWAEAHEELLPAPDIYHQRIELLRCALR